VVEHETDRIFSVLANSTFDQPVLNLSAGIAFGQAEMPMEALKQVSCPTDINDNPGMVGKLLRQGGELKRNLSSARTIEDDRARVSKEMFWEDKGIYATFAASSGQGRPIAGVWIQRLGDAQLRTSYLLPVASRREGIHHSPHKVWLQGGRHVISPMFLPSLF
jgi:hypothetical protein